MKRWICTQLDGLNVGMVYIQIWSLEVIGEIEKTQMEGMWELGWESEYIRKPLSVDATPPMSDQGPKSENTI